MIYFFVYPEMTSTPDSAHAALPDHNEGDLWADFTWLVGDFKPTIY